LFRVASRERRVRSVRALGMSHIEDMDLDTWAKGTSVHQSGGMKAIQGDRKLRKSEGVLFVHAIKDEVEDKEDCVRKRSHLSPGLVLDDVDFRIKTPSWR